MSLLDKYNVAAPRYTSYPTVPYWSNDLTTGDWKKSVAQAFTATNSSEGISLYIHLPYCESLCTYCACNTRITVNHAVEETYIQSLLQEWKLYRELFDAAPRLRQLHLGGGTPTFFSPGNLTLLLEGILAGCVVCDDHDFSFEGHPSNTTRAHLEALAKHGFRRVSFGIQDFDEKVQDAINRYQSFDEVKAVTGISRATGYASVNYDLVYGLPFQTLSSVASTIEQVITLRPDRIAFYSYAHVPWLRPGQRKFSEKDLPADSEKRALYEYGCKAFIEAGYRSIGMDHFALPSDGLYNAQTNRMLHRNFMGYTGHQTRLLIGLGASSIGDTGNAFGQNIKTVEAYRDCVAAGRLPVHKGHLFTEEDLLVRRHIMDIMCQGETKWNGDQHGHAVIARGILRCASLADDGLVELSQDGLKVTIAGMSFLRNICLCFDHRYWDKQPEKQLFSTVA